MMRQTDFGSWGIAMTTETDMAFLAEVQRNGWNIVAVDESRVLAGCPRMGCGLRVTLKPGGKVPATCKPEAEFAEQVIGSGDDLRQFLRKVRDRMMLSIKDVEVCAGMPVDLLAKIEKDNPSKRPSLDLALEWAQALGCEIVVRRAALPRLTLRTLVESLPMMKHRRARQGFHQSRRSGGLQSDAD